jgi:chemotaxis protein CheD
MLGTATLSAPQQLAGMGQIVMVSGEELARAVLGSCVGVSMYDASEKLGALAHIVLPASEGRPGSPGKFVDTAIPWMIEALQKRGAIRRRLVAKLTGGSRMFATQGPFMIGENNAEAARKLLKQLKISLACEHVGGSHGRRATLDGATGMLTLEVVGESTVCI